MGGHGPPGACPCAWSVCALLGAECSHEGGLQQRGLATGAAQRARHVPLLCDLARAQPGRAHGHGEPLLLPARAAPAVGRVPEQGALSRAAATPARALAPPPFVPCVAALLTLLCLLAVLQRGR
eukprot:scaffold11881_cov52-Phaeocystis_antarctica.AAC.2